MLLLGQDDPKKCTAKRLLKFGLVGRVWPRELGGKLVLDPFSNHVLTPLDSGAKAVVAVDCSWRLAERVFGKMKRGIRRRLPLLVPANPTNYGHVGLLSSVEALSSALYILGFEAEAEKLLAPFKWGPEFLKLNKVLLEEYKGAKGERDVREVEECYFKPRLKV